MGCLPEYYAKLKTIQSQRLVTAEEKKWQEVGEERRKYFSWYLKFDGGFMWDF